MLEKITLTALREGRAHLTLTTMAEQGPRLFDEIRDELLAEIQSVENAGGRHPLHRRMVDQVAVGRLMGLIERTVGQEAAYRAAKLAAESRAADRGGKLVL